MALCSPSANNVLLDTMACTAPFDAFRVATESLGPELYRRASYCGIWLNLVQRTDYAQGTGFTQSSFTIQRSEPTTDEETWVRIAKTDPSCGSATLGASGSCGVCWNDTQWGFSECTYSPEQFGLRGPIICQDDLIYNFKAERFLEAYLQALTMRSRRSIENRYQNIYAHVVPKYIAKATFTQDLVPNACGSFTNGVAPTSPNLSGLSIATSELTQEMLDSIAARLNEEGASDPNSSGWINLGDDGPIYPLYIGQEASQDIALNNAELRQDYRWAEPMALIKRIGASRVIRNFRHVINLFPPRYNFIAGNYVRIPTWIMPAKTGGNGAEINPSWRSAAFEAAFVLNPWVFHSEIVQPVNSAAGLSWSPKNYMGEWRFEVGGREIDDAACYDPTKKLARHFAEFKHAARPIFPQYGAMIIFRRCPVSSFGTVTCAS